jgi:hypothetical protein
MPTTIKEAIKKLTDAIAEENATTGGKSITAQTMQDLAVPAILAGQFGADGKITPAWRAYMTFLLSKADVQNPADLQRLLPEDGTLDAPRQKERAYATGNGMCGTGTGARVLDGTTTDALDKP